MKVLAFDCGPILDSSSPTLILAAFLGGMKQAGAQVELFCTRDLHIGPFRGDLACWLPPARDRRQSDDMRPLFPKLQDADVWVFATPVHSAGMSSMMKNLLDRMAGLTLPSLELREGHSRPRLREGTKQGKCALVASCAAWELETFDPLVAHTRAFCANVGRTFCGALLRPHSLVLTRLIDLGTPLTDVFDGAFVAGRTLVAQDHMDSQDISTVNRQLLPLDLYLQFVNERLPQKLRQLSAKHMALREPAEGKPRKKRAPRVAKAGTG